MNKSLLLVVLISITAPFAIAETDKDTMRVLYHDLDMLRAKALKQYGVRVDVTDAVESCIGKNAILDECRKTTTAFEDKIHARIYEQQLLAEQRRTNDILAGQKSAGDSNNGSIIINNQDPDRYEHHHYHHGDDDYWGRPTPLPIPRPTPFGFVPQNRFQARDPF